MRLRILVAMLAGCLFVACDTSSEPGKDAAVPDSAADLVKDVAAEAELVGDGSGPDGAPPVDRQNDGDTEVEATGVDTLDTKDVPDNDETGEGPELPDIQDIDLPEPYEIMDVDGDGQPGDSETLETADADLAGGELDGSDGDGSGDVEVTYPDIACCFPTETPGCANSTIETCVCYGQEGDSYCCTVAWDANCVAEVASKNCGTCDPSVQCGDGTCDVGEACETCPADCGTCPSICGDGQCQLPETCSTCPKDCGVCAGSSCCKSWTTPGCDQPEVQECVCNKDTYCCSISWDSNCVYEVKSYGCGWCEE